MANGNAKKSKAGRQASSRESILQKEKVLRCYALRKHGKTWDFIAQREGYADPSGPYKAVMNYLKAVQSDTAEDHRQIMDGQIDEMTDVFYTDATNPDAELRYEAADQVLKLLDRRAKLHGLDTKQLNLGGADGAPLSLKVVLARGLELAERNPSLLERDGD